MRCLVLWFVLVVPVPAQTGLEHAWRARVMLGDESWSRVITVNNEAKRSRYPRTVHALVFEFAGILWFYTDVDGTQSFSLHQDRLEAEKGDFAPLLRDIEPGFATWSVEASTPADSLVKSASLPNGCFVESVAAWRERMRRGEKMENARLLSYYAEAGKQRAGHTVLAYDVKGGVEVFDPARPKQPRVFNRSIGHDPLELARALDGPRIAKARYVVPRPEPLAVETIASAESMEGAMVGDDSGYSERHG